MLTNRTGTINNSMFSSNKSDWETPWEFFDKLNAEFNFTLDPCATGQNTKCPNFFSKEDNGLEKEWTGWVFMNPPYGRGIGAWVKKAYESSLKAATVVCLLPSRTDTSWWHDYCMKGDVRFVRGRLKFSNSKNSAPFPSAVVIFKAKFGPEVSNAN